MDVIKGVGKAKGQYLIYTDDGEYICSTLDEDIANEIKTALEKRIPKRPQKHREIQNNATYLCPTCNRLHWSREYVNNYCDSCGQRFDLGEGEE